VTPGQAHSESVRSWKPAAEDFDGVVPGDVLERIGDLSVELRPRERVECVAVATKPRLVLLVLSDSHLNRAYWAGGVCEFDGTGRDGVRGRMKSDRLIVSGPSADNGTEYGGLVPAGAAERIAAELHKPYRPDNFGTRDSVPELRW
jgi:hypothetical protein